MPKPSLRSSAHIHEVRLTITLVPYLANHATVKQVNYPKTSPTRPNYDRCRNPNGGYGGLLSATFYRKQDAVAFFDNLDTVKGPSLGTNFTLSSPYVILAHYGELDWVSYQSHLRAGIIC
jgi:cystathionine gamma-synthase